jgi:hypothetical protein
MPYSTNTVQTNVNDMENELCSSILSYLLQDHIVMLDGDMVPESYLESLFENIRDDLFERVQHGEISSARCQDILSNLISKSYAEGMDSTFRKPSIRVQVRMIASIEKC